MSAFHDQTLTCAALNMATQQRKPEKGLLVHSDQGVQYVCTAFQGELSRQGFVASMSRRGNCWDNAPAESFFSTLKTELVYQSSFASHLEAKAAVVDYIEAFYNRRRRHSAIGYAAPAEYEAKAVVV